jgi:hypothetical protein
VFVAADSSPLGLRSFELASETLDMICDLSSIYHHPHRRKTSESLNSQNPVGELRLSNGVVVGYFQVNIWLSLLYILNGDSHPGKPEQLSHNVNVTCQAVCQVLETIGDL